MKCFALLTSCPTEYFTILGPHNPAITRFFKFRNVNPRIKRLLDCNMFNRVEGITGEVESVPANCSFSLKYSVP